MTWVEELEEIAVSPGVLHWLLEEGNPSIRYLTMVDILRRGEDEEEVARAKRSINGSGWAARILASQKEGRYWVSPETCYTPKYDSGLWKLIVLADLAASDADPRIRAGCEHFLALHNVKDGGFDGRGLSPHVCHTGNMVRTLFLLGFRDDERVRKAVDWLLDVQLEDGGWNCWEGHRGHGSIGSTIQPLWAFSEIPREERSPEVRQAIAQGIEFYLRHRLYKSCRDDSVIDLYALKFRYPVHDTFDVLHGLRVLTYLGVRDERLADALTLLLSKRLPDGTWPLEGVFRGWRVDRPMHGKGLVDGRRPEEDQLIEKGWGREPHTLQLEEAGKPSKVITLNALRVLRQLDILRLPEGVLLGPEGRPRTNSV